MQQGTWYQDDKIKNKDVLGQILFGRDFVRLFSDSGSYTVAEASLDISGFSGSGAFDFSLAVKSKEMDYKLIYTWFDQDGTELQRGYLKNSDILRCPASAYKLMITLLAFGNYPGFVEAGFPHLSKKKTDAERKATVASISIEYGYNNEHWKRTCEENLRDSLDRIDSLALDYKLDLIALTECFYSRCIAGIPLEKKLLSMDSPQIAKMREKAKEHNVYLAFSFLEKEKSGKIYNTALLIDRRGEIAAVYHKIHLTLGEYEMGMTPGTQPVVAETDFGKVGLAICWDFFFPEHCRMLRLMGAELVINPTAGFLQEQSVMRARENGMYVLNAGTRAIYSKIFDPNGKMIANSDYGAAVATIDFNEQKLVHYLSVDSWAAPRNIMINERKADVYHGLVKTRKCR